MKVIVALLMGLVSGFLIYMIGAMLFVDLRSASGPSPVFVAVTFLGGWAVSTWLLLRGTRTVSRVCSRGFLLGAAEWFVMIAVGLVWGGRVASSTLSQAGVASGAVATGAALGGGMVAFLTGGVSIAMAVVCLIGFAISYSMGREMSREGPITPVPTKKCPECAEMVQEDARRCRYCGATFVQPPQDVLPRSPVVLPPVETFIDNDPGYQDWLVQHPDGFVLHCYRHRPQSSMALHQATCATISKPSSSSQPGEFTSKQYFKVCSISAEALATWAYHEGFRKNLVGCVSCTVSLPEHGLPLR